MDPERPAERPNTTSTNITEELPSAPEDYFIKDLEITLETPVLSSEYLHSTGLICFGCEDGTTRIFSPTKKAVQYTLVKDDKSPVMCIASTSPSSIIKNTVMVVHTGGTLEYWHATSNQLLFQKKVLKNEFSMTRPCIAARSAVTTNGTQFPERTAICSLAISIKGTRLPLRLAKWVSMRTEFSVSSGIPLMSILSSVGAGIRPFSCGMSGRRRV